MLSKCILFYFFNSQTSFAQGCADWQLLRLRSKAFIPCRNLPSVTSQPPPRSRHAWHCKCIKYNIIMKTALVICSHNITDDYVFILQFLHFGVGVYIYSDVSLLLTCIIIVWERYPSLVVVTCIAMSLQSPCVIAFLTCITLKFIVICSYSKLLLYIFSEFYTARCTLVTCTSSTNPASENQFQYQNLFTEPDTEPDSNPASEIHFHFQNLLQNRYYIITFKSKRPAVRSDGPLPLVLR